MSNGGFTVSAAACHAPKNFQMAKASLPSQEVQQAIGRTAIRFGQLEPLLKLIYKRSRNNISLEACLEKLDGGSLGALLGGIRYGEVEKFEGLIKLAESNSQLASALEELKQAEGLSKIRKRYVHNGIGKTSDGKFVFYHTGELSEEDKMCEELDQASTLAESIFLSLNTKIPPPKSEERG